MTSEQHNKYVAYAFLGHGSFQLLMLVLILAMFLVFIPSIPVEPGTPPPPKEMFVFMAGFMAVFQLFFTAPSLIAAYALLKKKSWARMAAIVGGIISAMSVPTGTAACIYSLWFFFGDNWKSVYPEKAEQHGAVNQQIAYGVESQRAAYQEEESREKVFDPYNPPDWR